MEMAAGSLKRFTSASRKRRTWLLIVTIATGIAVTAAVFGKRTKTGDYITARVDRGNVDVIVSATGTVQAVTTVEIGTQVSGTVSWLGADFKSKVKRGQVIAKLDPAIFLAQVDNQQAALRNAQAAVQAATADINDQLASLNAAKANEAASAVARDEASDLVARDQELKDEVPRRDVEAAQAEADADSARYQQAAAQAGQAQASLREARAKLDEAKAGVSQAQAELDQARVNLNHAIIISPIDGVVVSRNIDVGQTVAASLQAPVLFVVANDLNNMQVLAAIDEADVGQIHEGITATFSVDAYPGQEFSGRISQIRLNAQNQQNVVTYSTVIDVSNTDQRLLPGMTANITIPVAHADDVLTVPNAALRFKPEQPQAVQPQGGQPQHGQKPASEPESEPSNNGPEVEEGGSQHLRTIWVLNANNELEPRLVKVGITNGRVSAIVEGDLSEGDAIVIGQNEPATRGR
jgi:HlyD family secretion protein